jgi:hypothetical protein
MAPRREYELQEVEIRSHEEQSRLQELLLLSTREQKIRSQEEKRWAELTSDEIAWELDNNIVSHQVREVNIEQKQKTAARRRHHQMLRAVHLAKVETE